MALTALSSVDQSCKQPGNGLGRVDSALGQRGYFR